MDGTVKVWLFKADMRPFRFNKHKAPVNCCDFSRNGKFLATGGDDTKVFIWRVGAEGKNINFKAHAAVRGI